LFLSFSLFYAHLRLLFGFLLLYLVGLPLEAAAPAQMRNAVAEGVTTDPRFAHFIVMLTELYKYQTVDELDQDWDHNHGSEY